MEVVYTNIKQKSDMVVSKSISLPLGLIEAVLDEAFLMNCSFSEAVTRLLRTALAIRKQARQRESSSEESDKK